MSEQDKVERIIGILRHADRIGADKDDPEGARYIQISDTLAKELANDLDEYLRFKVT